MTPAMNVLGVLTDFPAGWIHQAAPLFAVTPDNLADNPLGRFAGPSSFPCSDLEAQRTLRLKEDRPLKEIHGWVPRALWFLSGAIR